MTGLAVERIDAGDITGTDGAIAAALAIALAGLLAAILSAAAGVVNSRVSTVIETDLRSRLYHHFQVVDPRVLESRTTGDLVSLASSDLVPIAQFFGNRLARGLQGVVTMVLAGAIMVWLEPLLALLALAPLPVGVLILATYTHRASAELLQAAARWERRRRRCKRPSPGPRPCAPTPASPSSASASPAPPSGCWMPRSRSTGWPLAR